MASTNLDTFINLTPLEIPRPKCQGMQFVPTRGRYGFYRTIRAEGSKYGVHMKSLGPRRPVLSKELFNRPQTVHEVRREDERQEESAGSVESVNTSSSSSHSSSDRSSPVEIEPDYPVEEESKPNSSVPSSSPQRTLSTKF